MGYVCQHMHIARTTKVNTGWISQTAFHTHMHMCIHAQMHAHTHTDTGFYTHAQAGLPLPQMLVSNAPVVMYANKT